VFDVDSDGKLSQKEWLAMHEAAKLAVLNNHHREHASSANHLIHQSNDGRPFLISSMRPEKLAGRYRLYLVIGLLLFLGGGAASIAMLFGQLIDG
jgi:hypothetical protein